MTDSRPPDRPVRQIRGELVYLRPAERDDLDRFVRWFADGETTRNLLVRAPFNRAMEDQWFEAMVARQGKTDYHFVICLLSDDEPIGTVGLHDIDFVDGHAEFGIMIGVKGAWNKGYGTDALRAICDFGFGELRLERIELEVYAGNARGRRSYEKAGFTLEGTLRRRHFTQGRHEDVLIMALLRDEWAAQDRPRSWELNELG
jgi:RimJ/RimL family protein N-acetyltransferase